MAKAGIVEAVLVYLDEHPELKTMVNGEGMWDDLNYCEDADYSYYEEDDREED